MGGRETGGARSGGRASGELEHPLRADHRADVVGVTLAEIGEDELAERVELAAESLGLLTVERGSGDGGAHLGSSACVSCSTAWALGIVPSVSSLCVFE
jgi:hypothetical protein